jgi:hypothetical protein
MTARYRRDDDGALHRVVPHDGVAGYHVTFTTSCSGCCELGEYMGNAHSYPYDSKAQCHVGAGCHECGHSGKRRFSHWVPFDYDSAMEVRP